MLTLVFPFTHVTVWARRSQKWTDSRRDWLGNQTIKIRVTEPNLFLFFNVLVTQRERENRELKGTIADDLLYYISIV